VSWLLVMVGGAVGAPVRYLVHNAVQPRTRPTIQAGTLAVNLIGCFVLGCLVGASSEHVRLLLGTGFCGALTTFSAFGWETAKLDADGHRRAAGVNVALSVGLGLAAAALGVSLTT